MTIGRYQFHHQPKEERTALLHLIELATIDWQSAKDRRDAASGEERARRKHLTELQRRLLRLEKDGLP